MTVRCSFAFYNTNFSVLETSNAFSAKFCPVMHRRDDKVFVNKDTSSSHRLGELGLAMVHFMYNKAGENYFQSFHPSIEGNSFFFFLHIYLKAVVLGASLKRVSSSYLSPPNSSFQRSARNINGPFNFRHENLPWVSVTCTTLSDLPALQE